MVIEMDYKGSKEVLKPIIEAKIQQLISSSIPLPPGVVVIKPTANWLNDTLFFSFKIQVAGLLTKKIKGKVILEDKKIKIDCDVPKIYLEQISQETIKDKVVDYTKRQIINSVT